MAASAVFSLPPPPRHLFRMLTLIIAFVFIFYSLIRLKWDKEKQNVSTLSHPSSQRSAERTPHGSRSLISFTDLRFYKIVALLSVSSHALHSSSFFFSTPKRLVLKLDKMDPCGDAGLLKGIR